MDKNKQYILKYAESLYNAKAVNEYTIGNSENLIFEIEKEAAPYILRVSEYSGKKKAHIDFELNWVNYLAAKLDNIVRPVKSANNNLYEVISSGEKNYVICLFEKANGKVVDSDNPMEFNDKLFFDLGALMGNMHRLTAEYEGNSVIIPEFERYHTEELSALPKSKDCYGIIHDDVHIHNFFVDNGHISLFDFDDCRFSWYADDMASALFYMIYFTNLFEKSEKYINEFAENYLCTYFRGYTLTNTINKYCVSKFNLFLKYRMTGVYSYLTDMYKNNPENPYRKSLNWLKHKLDNDLPYVDINYEKIINSLKVTALIF
jgi:Ser/Thr protein kinase RdoA (MazF antagonist)